MYKHCMLGLAAAFLVSLCATSTSSAALHWEPGNHGALMNSSNFNFEVETRTAGQFEKVTCEIFTIFGTLEGNTVKWPVMGSGATECSRPPTMGPANSAGWEMTGEAVNAAKLLIPAAGFIAFEIPRNSNCKVVIGPNPTISGEYKNKTNLSIPSVWTLARRQVTITQTLNGAANNCFSTANVGFISARFAVTDVSMATTAIILAP
jgi:hypothetical protein